MYQHARIVHLFFVDVATIIYGGKNSYLMFLSSQVLLQDVRGFIVSCFPQYWFVLFLFLAYRKNLHLCPVKDGNISVMQERNIYAKMNVLTEWSFVDYTQHTHTDYTYIMIQTCAVYDYKNDSLAKAKTRDC